MNSVGSEFAVTVLTHPNRAVVRIPLLSVVDRTVCDIGGGRQPSVVDFLFLADVATKSCASVEAGLSGQGG